MPTTFMSSVVADKDFHTTTSNIMESTAHPIVYVESHSTSTNVAAAIAPPFTNAHTSSRSHRTAIANKLIPL